MNQDKHKIDSHDQLPVRNVLIDALCMITCILGAVFIFGGFVKDRPEDIRWE